MAIETSYINFSDLGADASLNTKLYIDQYDSTQLANAVNIKVTELITALPTASLNLVPKPVYDAELSHSADLQQQVNILTADNDALKSRVQALLADSSSLYIDNDGLRIAAAKLENTVASVQKTTLELRTNLTTSLTKAINEATERTALEAENSGLTAQKNALIKQIDTLNNLLAQANATIQVAQQQLSAKQQAVAAGGVSTGELSTIIFDAGDITKSKLTAMINQDYNGGPNGVKDKFTKPGDNNGEGYVTYFDVVAGPKDISVSANVTGGYTIIPWDFGVSLPVTLKANETKRFGMVNANQQWVNNYKGNDGGSFFSRSSPTVSMFTFSVVVKDVDPNGKTENKNFTGKIWKH